MAKKKEKVRVEEEGLEELAEAPVLAQEDIASLAQQAAETYVEPTPLGLTPVYAAVDFDVQYGGRFYSIPAGTVGLVPKACAPTGSNTHGVRTLHGDDTSALEGNPPRLLSPSRRYELNVVLVASAIADLSLSAAPPASPVR